MAKVDIPEYPDNSITKDESGEEKPSARIVDNSKRTVKVKKKGLGKKFSETFLAEDADIVGKHLTKEVLIPAAKDTFSEFVSRGLDMFLYRNDEYRPSRSGYSGRSRSKSGRDREYYSYDEPHRRRREDDRVRMTDRGRSMSSFDLEFDYRDDAMDVYHFMKDKLHYEEYPFVGVRDLFEFVKSRFDWDFKYDWSYDRYGWYNLDDMTVRKVRDKWVLKLPRAELID